MSKISGYKLHFLNLGQSYDLHDSVSIGRMGQDLNLDMEGISFKHCSLFFQDGILSIKDHESAEGTFVNGNKISSEELVILFPEDKISIGVHPVSLSAIFEKVEEVIKPVTPSLPAMPSLPEQVAANTEGLPDLPKPRNVSLPEKSDLPPLPTNSLEKSNFNLATSESSGASGIDDQWQAQTDNYRDTEIREAFSGHDQTNTVQFSHTKEKKNFFGFLKRKNKNVVETDNNLPKAAPSSQKLSATQVSVDMDSTGLIDNSQFRQFKKERFQEEALKSGIIFPVRFLAFIIDVNLAIIVGYFFKSNGLEFSSLTSPIEGILSFLFGSKYSGFAFFIFVFVLLKIIFNIICRRSLGQLVSLVFVEKKKKANLRALGRSVLGFLLGPFMFFDVPAFVSRSTAKEVLLLSRFYSSSHLFSFLASIFFFLLTSFFAYYLPVMNSNKSQVENFEYKTVKFVENSGIADDLNASSYFNFSQPSIKKKFLYYPYFKTKKVKNVRQYFPLLRLYFAKPKVYVDFEKVDSFNLKDLLESARSTNPLFGVQYPDLNYFLDEVGFDKRAFLEQFKNLLNRSLDLNTGSVSEYLFKVGPFIKGYSDLKDSLSNLISRDIGEVGFFEIGGKNFLRIKSEDGKFSSENSREEYLLALEEEKGLIFRVLLDGLGSRKKQQTMEFYHSFLDRIFWGDNEFSSLTETIHGYEVIDYFLKPEKRDHTEEEHEKIHQFYFRLAKKIVQAKNDKLKKDFSDKIESFLKMLVGLNNMEQEKGTTQTKYSKLVENISKLLNAFKEENKEYFGVKVD